ncbi:MAG: SDR family NAD(P)-dependent oxidoreductase [Deltaproteobacteria bacterium]|nr:SDR family NAD(P)-dependent oxidoreductase [Deltaproteobacteria bacterium]
MPNVTLITGAAGALGSAVVAHLLQQGHKIAAVDLPRSAERLAKLPSGALGLPFDANDPAAWREPMARVEKELGPLTGAVLIAGGWQGGGPLHARADDAIWKAMLGANLESAYRALRAVLPGLVERKAGSIVVVGSRAAVRPDTSAGAAEYAATKSAVVSLCQAVAAEVLSANVRVNAVLPSTIDTPANRAGMPQADFSAWVNPASLASVISFLLSDASKDVSGAALPVYGRA